MRRELSGLAALTAATLLLAACGGDSGTGTTTSQPDSTTPVGVEITVTATEFKFEPDPLMVPADTEVTITLVNNGVVEHDISIDELDFHMLANPGQTVSDTITIPAGIYMVYCAVPGHHEAGMMVELIASG